MFKTLLVSILILSSHYINAKLPPGAKWYKGDVESAFSLAKSQNKPLFLYWGAVWCPPCNRVQKNVFKTSLFKKSIKQFIPVYLNGDHENAQRWGEKLNAKGYPTMLILSPQGKELVRLPTGISAKQYTNIMNQTAKKLLSITDLITKGRSSKLDKVGWSLLAYYSWDQDYSITQNSVEKSKLLLELYKLTPKHLVEYKSRFFLLNSILPEQKKITDKLKLKKFLRLLLNSPELLTKNTELITDYASEFIEILKTDKAFLKEYFDKVSLLGDKKQTSLISKMSFLNAKTNILLKADCLKKKRVDVEKRNINSQILKLTSMPMDSYQRQSVMSTGIWLLIELNDLKNSKKLAIEQLKKSKAPYYFMSYLAYISELEKDMISSLKWRKAGYEEATGNATKFQWGVKYLQSQLKMKKINHSLLKETYTKIFKEVTMAKDAFNGRNQYRFKALAKNLIDYKSKHNKQFEELGKVTKSICKSNQNCKDWGKSKVSPWKFL